jgi:hypothetical protein
VTRGTGIHIGRVKHPRDLATKGRGRLRPAFEEVTRRTGQTGPISELADLPEGNLRVYLHDVAGGVTPAIAGSVWFGVNISTVSRWLAEGRSAECKDQLKRDFARRTDQAVAYGRADAESRVVIGDPLAALTRGPLGRTTKDVPGWSDERRIALTDGDGKPLSFELVLEIGDGYVTKPALPEARDVTEAPAE